MTKVTSNFKPSSELQFQIDLINNDMEQLLKTVQEYEENESYQTSDLYSELFNLSINRDNLQRDLAVSNMILDKGVTFSLDTDKSIELDNFQNDAISNYFNARESLNESDNAIEALDKRINKNQPVADMYLNYVEEYIKLNTILNIIDSGIVDSDKTHADILKDVKGV